MRDVCLNNWLRFLCPSSFNKLSARKDIIADFSRIRFLPLSAGNNNDVDRRPIYRKWCRGVCIYEQD